MITAEQLAEQQRAARRCFCGGQKASAFFLCCQSCMDLLPIKLRIAFYKRQPGAEEDAKDWLKSHFLKP